MVQLVVEIDDHLIAGGQVAGKLAEFFHALAELLLNRQQLSFIGFVQLSPDELFVQVGFEYGMGLQTQTRPNPGQYSSDYQADQQKNKGIIHYTGCFDFVKIKKILTQNQNPGGNFSYLPANYFVYLWRVNDHLPWHHVLIINL
jgi:hypothetical protein